MWCIKLTDPQVVLLGGLLPVVNGIAQDQILHSNGEEFFVDLQGSLDRKSTRLNSSH